MRIALDASRIRFEVIDKGMVLSLYNDDYIKEQYRNDLEVYTYQDFEGASYLGMYVDGDLAGMFYCVEITEIEVEVHLAFYKEYTLYSRDICKEFIRYLFEDCEYYRVTTYVMDYRRKAVNLALKLGFRYEGLMKKCTIRDGIWYDKHVLGIVR